MDNHRWIAVVAVALMGVCGAARGESQTLTYADLVKRMIDMEHLAVLPAEGERGGQWSSYDRRSRYDAASDRYVDWAANLDGDGYIRREGDDIVMAEMEGPGVLWRIWSAHVRTGQVRIYIDGADTPVIDMPFAHFFDGQTAPFDFPALSYQTEITSGEFADRHNLGGGRNLYFPIPYQKSIKVVGGPDWGRYFQIGFTEFPQGTRVPSFTGRLSAEDRAAVTRLADFLTHRQGEDPARRREGQETHRATIDVGPGEKATVIELEGPRAITALRVKMNVADRDEQIAALRQLAIQMHWDDKTEPAVWSPLGDFFGTSVGVNQFRSVAAGMSDDGFYSYWYMPFAKRGHIELVNDGDQARQVEFEVVHVPLNRPFEGLGHFHAKWHRDVFPVRADRWPDWAVLHTQGRGRFVGMMLDVWHPRGGGATPEEVPDGWHWWGEGDEKFFVDGERFPSIFGTGVEDYFGYAWCDPARFIRPLHGQTLTEGNAGHQSMYRWQIADNVPFQESFHGYIEKYFSNEWPTLFATVAYWYLSPDGEDPHLPEPMDQRLGQYVRPPMYAGGYEFLGPYRGQVTTQLMGGFTAGRWHNDDQLWWQGAAPNDELQIVVPVERAGRYAVSAVLTRAGNYAVVQLRLNDKPAGPERIDLFDPQVTETPPINLGVHELNEGRNILTVRIVGKNRQAEPHYMFGLDRIDLQPQ